MATRSTPHADPDSGLATSPVIPRRDAPAARRHRPSFGDGLAVAVAAGLAIASFGAFTDDPAGAAESGYLAVLTVLLLGCAAALLAHREARHGWIRRAAGPTPSRVGPVPFAAGFVVLAAWILHPGPGRGAAVLAVLALAVVLAAARAWPAWLAAAGSGGTVPMARGGAGPKARGGALPMARGSTAPTARGGGAPVARGGAVATGTDRLLLPALRAAGLALPALVAVQLLFRFGELIPFTAGPRAVVLFAAMPLVGSLALAVLALRRGAAAASLAGATVVLWNGGLDVAGSVALAALAAGEVLRDPGFHPGDGVRSGDDAHASGGARSAGAALALRGAAVAVLVVPFAWQPRTAAVAAAAALLTLGRRPVDAAVAVAALLALFAVPLRDWSMVAPVLGLALLLLPTLPVLAGLGPVRRSRDRITFVAGLGVLLAAARCAPALVAAASPGLAPEAATLVPGLAAPLALLALLLGRRRSPASAEAAGGAVAAAGHTGSTGGATMVGRESGPRHALTAAWRLQAAWSAGLVVAAGLAAAYPWLRPEPARTVLAVLGLDPAGAAPWVVAAVAGAVVAFTAVAFPSVGSASADVPGGSAVALRRPVIAAGILLVTWWVLGAAPAPPFGHTLVGPPGVLLSADQARYAAEIPVCGDLASGRARRLVLVGSLVHAEGLADGTPVAHLTLRTARRPAASWTLRAGDDLGEWAARRPEVAAALRHRPPPPWASWIAPGGEHLGLLFRAERRFRTGRRPEGEALGGALRSRDASLQDGERRTPAGAAAPRGHDGSSGGESLDATQGDGTLGDATLDDRTLDDATLDDGIRVELERADGLPPGVLVHVRRIEAWP